MNCALYRYFPEKLSTVNLYGIMFIVFYNGHGKINGNNFKKLTEFVF